MAAARRLPVGQAASCRGWKAARPLPPHRPRRARPPPPSAALPASVPRPLPDWQVPNTPVTPFFDDEPEPETDAWRSSSPPPSSSSAASTGLKPLPRNVEGVADDVSLHNPLQRMERLGTAWCVARLAAAATGTLPACHAAPPHQPARLCHASSPTTNRHRPHPRRFGTIFELDGVCIEYECGDGGRSWQALAAEEGKPPPPLWALKKAEGMKNEQVSEGKEGRGWRPRQLAAALPPLVAAPCPTLHGVALLHCPWRRRS